MTDWTPVGPPRLLGKEDARKWKPASDPQSVQLTPEQRYEQGFKRFPKAVQAVAPSTLGEVGYLGGAAVGAGAAALAPETLGGSLAVGLPIAGAMMGGALEDPKHRTRGALWEGAKGVGQEVLGKAAGKASELAGRFLFKNSMLQKTADRIGEALPQLFSGYPLSVPNTAKDLEDQIPSGQLSQAFGKRLGALRSQIGAFTSMTGTKFKIPDIDAAGKTVLTDMSAPEAIDHIRSLQAAGWSTSGSAKSAQEAWRSRETAHNARDMFISQLNAVQPGLGHQYGEMSGDYGAALHLEKIFKQSYRSDGEIDQPALLRGLRNEIDDINKFKGFRRGIGFRAAVAPDRSMAEPEIHMMGHAHAGREGIRSRFRIPTPFKPESRQMIPWGARALSNKKALPVVGYGLEKGGEDVLEE